MQELKKKKMSNLLAGLNRIADSELHRKRTRPTTVTRRDCSDKELAFWKRKKDIVEVKQQRNGKWTVKYRR